ncbi:MAG TPA: four helix bundle protein [Planctomycetota bacterium]
MGAEFTKLRAWQAAYAVGLEIYNLACRFPHPHLFALGGQLQRAALSMSNNLAEGSGRRGSRDKKHFYVIAYASGAEAKNMLFFARDLQLISAERFDSLFARLDETCRLIHGLLEGMSRWIDP